ncbi:MAG: hypothetical protein M1823_001745 [Watsoniomyces obsoletus]|nr:MAG: hypothetical protein M1823_001745 [Watsoniomyces obsoletus]
MYRKHFVPLESDPEIFTRLMHDLGGSTALEFVDVWSLDECEQWIPRPVLALILVVPTSDTYEEERALRNSAVLSGPASDPPPPGVMWFQQTINNACGLYALLHAVCNIEREKYIGGSLSITPGFGPFLTVERAGKELEGPYQKAAMEGSSGMPPAEEDVDHHYTCFTKAVDGHIYELDGDMKGPIKKDAWVSAEQDIMTPSGLDIIRDQILGDDGQNIGFTLLALVYRVE